MTPASPQLKSQHLLLVPDFPRRRSPVKLLHLLSGVHSDRFGVFVSRKEEFRKDYKEKHPNVKQVSVIGKASADKWKPLSDAEKAPYVSKAEKLKAEYTKKMDAYNNKQAEGPTAFGDSDKSKSEVNDEDEGNVEPR